jgi:hypothetical protein
VADRVRAIAVLVAIAPKLLQRLLEVLRSIRAIELAVRGAVADREDPRRVVIGQRGRRDDDEGGDRGRRGEQFVHASGVRDEA